MIEADPVSALIDEARDGDYDLLVMGNKGMTGLSRFFKPGSVPGKVVPPPPVQPAHRQDDVIELGGLRPPCSS